MLDKIITTLLQIDIATAVMIVILFLGGWVLYKVQKDPDNNFNFEDMLRDETGHPSAFRLAIFVQLAVSTWVIMFIVLKTNALDTWMFVQYLGIWSGAKIAETALKSYGDSRIPGRISDRNINRYQVDNYDGSDYGQHDRQYGPPNYYSPPGMSHQAIGAEMSQQNPRNQ